MNDRLARLLGKIQNVEALNALQQEAALGIFVKYMAEGETAENDVATNLSDSILAKTPAQNQPVVIQKMLDAYQGNICFALMDPCERFFKGCDISQKEEVALICATILCKHNQNTYLERFVTQVARPSLAKELKESFDKKLQERMNAPRKTLGVLIDEAEGLF